MDDALGVRGPLAHLRPGTRWPSPPRCSVAGVGAALPVFRRQATPSRLTVARPVRRDREQCRCSDGLGRQHVLKRLDHLGGTRYALDGKLQRDIAPELGVSGPIHYPHRTASQLGNNPVLSNLLARAVQRFMRFAGKDESVAALGQRFDVAGRSSESFSAALNLRIEELMPCSNSMIVPFGESLTAIF